ncbi:hypothetical protein O5D80_005733 [Batrachochytrium dendrobatidis]|nr:hypothetical protein O5D80_005733 [Batrachochytrium dendrobatidis]
MLFSTLVVFFIVGSGIACAFPQTEFQEQEQEPPTPRRKNKGLRHTIRSRWSRFQTSFLQRRIHYLNDKRRRKERRLARHMMILQNTNTQ